MARGKITVTEAGIVRGAVDLVDGPARCKKLFPADALLELVSFLPHEEAHRILEIPLSKIYLSSCVRDENVWKARCVGQWKVPAFSSSSGWRALHADLVRSLSLINGTSKSATTDYKNVIAIVDVLDVYRTLVEVARACFGRLAQLLDRDEAREATKCVDVRIMEHALWTLKTYPEDVDMQLKILRFLVLAGRPVGGTEGMVLHRLPVSDGALKAFGSSGEGIAAVLACMKRHQSHADIQAMACWSMVNLALIADQKRVLVREGGISAIVRAMARHPEDSEVHFRAMFALINLVTPDVTVDHSIPIDIVQSVVTIVVSAIQVFSNIAAIVNRGCLVLHNIALDPGHFSALVAMGAPEELVQAIGKHPSDPLLRQCATGTLRRLHMGGALSNSLNMGAGAVVGQAPQAV